MGGRPARADAYNPAGDDLAPTGFAVISSPRFLADVYDDLSRCNKCSLCQAVCPAYQINPVEWETARGRVALIRDAIEGRLELREIADGPLSTCLTCDNCVAACPPRVPTAQIVSRARQELHEQEGYPHGQRWLLRTVLPRPGGTRTLHRLSRAAQVTGLRAAARRLRITRWMGTVGAMAERVGPLPRRRADQRVAGLPAVTPPVRGRLGFLLCCYQNLVAPEATEAAMRVLLANGFELEVPRLGCFGLPAQSLGDGRAVREMAERTVTALTGLGGRGWSPTSRAAPRTSAATGTSWATTRGWVKPPGGWPVPPSSPASTWSGWGGGHPWVRWPGTSPSTKPARCPSTGRCAGWRTACCRASQS